MTFITGSNILDAIVLAVVSKERTYGYKITQDVKEVMDISESTLYPVLRRLEKSDCLETYDMEFGGRNRRYYEITLKGKSQLGVYLEDWKLYKDRLDKVLFGGAMANE